MKRIFFIGVIATAALAQPVSHSQIFADFESFADGQAGVVFGVPRRSPTTSGYLATTPNIGAVTATFPTGHSSARVFDAEFSVLASASNPWLRLTTANTTSIPNPTIDLNQNVAFDIYSDRTISLALGVRETDTTAAIGANGGTTGVIEWVGASGEIGSGATATPVPTRQILAGTWTHVVFNIDGEQTVGFTGNGVIDKGVNGKGVLEHLAIVPTAGSGDYKIYLDNFEVTPVPEPATYATVFGLLLLGAGILRKLYFQKQA